MIGHIKGHARFSVSGASISVDFQPKDGITAVVGPNNSGKTFTALESLRYLLFGSKALRGKLDSYAELDLNGLVHIHDVPYVFERSLKAARVLHDGEVLAVGQDEVSKKAAELLGYGLEVFDLCNAAVQGKTQSLGDMRPAQRKEQIDNVLRVTDVRVVEKALRDEANGLAREAEALVRTLGTKPDAPVEPEDYKSSNMLEADLNTVRAVRCRRESLESQLHALPDLDEPQSEEPTEEALEKALSLVQILQERKVLEQRMEGKPEKEPLTREQISDAEKMHEWEAELASRGPEPTMTQSEVEDALATWREHDRLSDPSIERELVKCPECDTEFDPVPVAPEPPAQSKAELLAEQRALMTWAEPLPTKPAGDRSLSPREALREHEARDAWEEAEQAARELAEKPEADPDAEKQLHELNNAKAEWSAYRKLEASRQEKIESNSMIHLALDELPEVDDADEIQQRLFEARAYEAALERYSLDLSGYEARQAEIEELKTDETGYREGAKSLSEARTELKSFLAPALSREASSLMFDMTNGVLQDLTVDEDMNISVDGQTLETLSGGGITVANIALRISFAKILTGSAFPVFIGDEMDGDLDVVRREATAQAMVSLKQHLKQIILITHKDVDIADHVLDLGEK